MFREQYDNFTQAKLVASAADLYLSSFVQTSHTRERETHKVRIKIHIAPHYMTGT